MVLTVADLKRMCLLEISGSFASDKISLNLILCYVCVALSIYGCTVASVLDIFDS